MSNIDACQKEIGKYLDSVYAISHSRQSVNAYRGGLNQFERFVRTTYEVEILDLVDAINQEGVNVFNVLQEFVVFLDKQNKKPSSIKLWITAVKGILRQMGIKIYSEDFRQQVKIPKKVRTRDEPLTKEIIVRLLHNVPPKLQAVILVAVASGMRIGEIVQLKYSDIDFNEKATRIRIRAKTTKTRESRETFLTCEATQALRDYLSRFFEWKEGESNSHLNDVNIFGRTALSRTSINNGAKLGDIRKTDDELIQTPEIVAKNVLISSLKKHIKKVPELSRLNENGRMIIHFHAFRKFFRTVVGDASGRDFAEALMGHHFYLDTYYNLPESKKKEFYLKAEPHLTIANFEAIEKDLTLVKNKQKEIEEKQLDLIQLIKNEHIEFPKLLEKYVK